MSWSPVAAILKLKFNFQKKLVQSTALSLIELMSQLTFQYNHLLPSMGVVPDMKHSISHDGVLSTHTVFELLKYSTRGVLVCCSPCLAE